jgi:hypothetical protein
MWRISWFMGAITLFFHFWELLELLLPQVTTSMDRGSHLEHVWMGIFLSICCLGIMGVLEIIVVVLDGFLFTHASHMSMDRALSSLRSSLVWILSFLCLDSWFIFVIWLFYMGFDPFLYM